MPCWQFLWGYVFEANCMSSYSVQLPCVRVRAGKAFLELGKSRNTIILGVPNSTCPFSYGSLALEQTFVSLCTKYPRAGGVLLVQHSPHTDFILQTNANFTLKIVTETITPESPS